MNNNASKTDMHRNEGRVNYIDGSALNRPLSMPYTFRFALAAFVIVAALIGGSFLFKVIDNNINAPKREVEATLANLSRDINIKVPVLAKYIKASDAAIMKNFKKSDFTLYEIHSVEETGENGFEVVKLPEDMSLEEASLMYVKGIGSLRSSEASKLLRGSWTMVVARAGFVDMKVKYSDFDAGSVESAVQQCIVQQKLADSKMGESGVDSAGNTFQKGKIKVKGTTYNWHVSACPLSEIYSIDGLPTTAVYVVMRMYTA